MLSIPCVVVGATVVVWIVVSPLPVVVSSRIVVVWASVVTAVVVAAENRSHSLSKH